MLIFSFASGVATNAESNGSGRNGSEGAPRGRSRSPGPGVQVAEVARAAAQRQLSVKLMELEAAATRADQMGDTEEVLRSVCFALERVGEGEQREVCIICG
jgi:hypothetical protein